MVSENTITEEDNEKQQFILRRADLLNTESFSQ